MMMIIVPAGKWKEPFIDMPLAKHLEESNGIFILTSPR